MLRALGTTTITLLLGVTPIGAQQSPPTLIRLLDSAGSDSWSGDASALEPHPTPWLLEEFEGDVAAEPGSNLPKGWSCDGACTRLASPGGVRVTAASGALSFDFPLEPDVGALVRLRARHAGSLTWLPLRAFAPRKPNPLLPIGPAMIESRRMCVRLDPQPHDEWQELELLVTPLPTRHGVRLRFDAGDPDLEVDRVEVLALTAHERALITPRAIDDTATVPWRRLMARDQMRADSLLLPPGATFGVSLRVPEHAPRLEFVVSALVATSDHPARLVARCDGAILLDRPVALAGTVESVVVPLAQSAGKEIRLELAVPADSGEPVGVGAPRGVGAPPTPRPNLILISIDTLRADRLHRGAGEQAITPNLDRLAAEGTRFSDFLAASTWTLPSHSTLFTGVDPDVHGASAPNRRLDAQRVPTLTQALAAEGFVTAAFTGGGYVGPAFGLAAGFDDHHVRDPARGPFRSADGAPLDPMEPTAEWLRSHRDLPFFLFLHTYVVHDYAAEPEYLARFTAEDHPLLHASYQALLKRDLTTDPAAPALLAARYDAVLQQTDEKLVGRLLALLDELALADRTLVAFVSDHGDQWREHGHFFHRLEPWPELTHVPFLLRGPGIERGAVRDEPCSHGDVAPTLLGRLHIGGLPLAQGRDLFAAVDPEQEIAPRLLSVDMGRHGMVHALIAGPWKLMRTDPPDDAAPTLALFRRDLDPGELHDCAAQEPQRCAELARLLEQRLATERALAATLGTDQGTNAPLDPAVQKQLRELGYAEDGR